uniref:Uncharacterized protein n=1 Tax=Avena sativa TaxID=4498 RepID=A0ACD5V2X7_AVESA
MLEMLFYKQMQRILSKQRESENWTGRICPKIRKKIEKFIEWSDPCMVSPGGNHLFSVSSHELERTYSVDMKSRTCDCRRWQLTGIPCHHAIACCRTANINPESLVHSCYTVDTYNKAYGFNLAPLIGRVFWKKTGGVVVHPPLFTKVMGRPKKNRRKAPEEIIKKGVKNFTKAGVTIHCSVCGRSDHNKRTHQRYMDNLMLQQQVHVTNGEEEMDTPEIMQHLIPQNPDPSMDPTHVQDSMVYILGQEENENVPLTRVQGPLPENAFVVAARDTIPQATRRVTTATTRGRGRGRGRGRSAGTSAIEPSRGGRGRGREYLLELLPGEKQRRELQQMLALVELHKNLKMILAEAEAEQEHTILALEVHIT